MKRGFHCLVAALLLAATSLFGQTDAVRSGRFTRGTGTNANYHSFVLSLDGLKGLQCANFGGTAQSVLPYLGGYSFGYHYNATNPGSSTNLSLRIPFVNPVAMFGSRVGGDPLHFGEQYRFVAFGGDPYPYFSSSLAIYMYQRTATNIIYKGATYFSLPNPFNTNNWSDYLTNGYTKTLTTNGLTTVVTMNQTYFEYGVANSGVMQLVHQASPAASNMIFQVEMIGLSENGYMAVNNTGTPDYSRLYTLEFEERAAWKSLFVEQPHFSGEPLPPAYDGKSAEELTSNAPPVQTTFTLANGANTYTNLDHSPELRRHPLLDQLVSDLRRDPVALARYVQNEIELTDALSYNDNGSITEVSVNPPGVARGALATYLEGQGGPAEQSALLVYLLRQAGTPAVYVYPQHNGMKMLDAQISRMLRIQFRGAVDTLGNTYTTNRLVPVNYPWVAAYIGTNWVHLFPWIKDTAVEEGLNLAEYMSTEYPDTFRWMDGYVRGRTNILSFADGDDTPAALFPKWLKNNLLVKAPGVSIDDIGVRFVNRRHSYARWQDFPRPLVAPASAVALDSLGSSAITNVFPGLTNIFDTFSVQVSSVANPSKKVASGVMRMVDIHNRRLLIRHEKTGANTHNVILSLSAFRPGATGATNFAAGDSLLNAQLIKTNLVSTDDSLEVRMVYNRHRSLPPAIFTNTPFGYLNYPRMSGLTTTTASPLIKKGDLAAVCLNVGRVSRAMLNVHAEELWNMERTLKVTPSATNSLSPDLYQGGTAYLMGMTYHEAVARFRDVNQQLNKYRALSVFANGLSKISAKRVGGALPNQGDVILNQPSVDMVNNLTASAFSGTLNPSLGEEGQIPYDAYANLNILQSSAQEHQSLNSFFRDSDSISTVKLLQLAQKRATNGAVGILHLNAMNYVQMGNSNVNGTLLKNHDPSMWTSISNFFNGSGASIRQGYVTPGSITNQSGSYLGMGSLLFKPGVEYLAYISPDLNGGYASTVPDNWFTAGNTLNYSLQTDAQNNFYVSLTAPGASSVVLAPDIFAGYSASGVANNATANYFAYTPFQGVWSGNVLEYAGLPILSGLNQNFAQSVQAAEGNSGFLGWLSDGLSQVASGVSDPVHAVTGEFYVDATDLVLPGPIPLVVNRNYSSLNTADNQFGFGWKPSYMPFLSIKSDGSVLYAAEPDGAVIAYDRTSTNSNVYLPTVARNPQLNNNTSAGIGSTANRLRNRIDKQVSGPDTFYYLQRPDGGECTFKVMTFNGGGLNRTRPYLTRWEDSRGNFLAFEMGTDATRTDYAEVRRIQSSNGGYLGFVYDVYGRIIEAWTGDGRRLAYKYDEFGDLVKVTFPDASEIGYEYERRTQNVTNGVSVTTASYSTHLLVRENKPDGRMLRNEYDAQRRVTNQWATVGLDLNPVRNASFVYSNNFALTNAATNTITGFTVIRDVFNNTNRYDYTSGLITKITDSLGQTVEQQWYADNATAPGHPRSLWKRKDKRGLWTELKYDAKGNVTNAVTWGDLLGDGSTAYATNSVAYNADNLPIETVDTVGNRVVTQYHAQFPFLPEYAARYAGATAIATNRFAYRGVTNIFVSGGVSYTNRAFGLLRQEIRAFGTAEAATNEWSHDGRGFITQSVRSTGTGDPDVTTAFYYNDRGEMEEQSDAAGRSVVFAYDAMGRPILREVFEQGQSMPLGWEYTYYNRNGEVTWSDGPQYNPEDYVWRDYDGGGRLSQTVRWRSWADENGLGVLPHKTLFATSWNIHDAFGNLVKSVDARGAFVTNRWDALGRLTHRAVFDPDATSPLSSEGFAYEPGGEVRFQTNALGGVTETLHTSLGQPRFRRLPTGATNAWRYYADGRLRREVQSNGAYWETTYQDSLRRVTKVFLSAAGAPLSTNITEFDRRGNVARTVDALGFVSTNRFDGLDRLKFTVGPVTTTVVDTGPPGPGGSGGLVTNTTYRASTNFYDASGLVLTNINSAGERTITRTDALGRMVRTEIRDKNNALVRETSTAYSPDHHSITVTNGSGSSAIATTRFMDHEGRTVLSVGYPAANVRHYTLSDYGLTGNLVYQGVYARTNSTRTLFTGTFLDYDGLNRLVSKDERDGAVTIFAYDGMGNVTNRTMPGGLQWLASYDNAGRMTKDFNLGAGGIGTRTNTQAFYTSGPFHGLLQSRTDGRGVTGSVVYDHWLRPTTNWFTGPLDEHGLTNILAYDLRGLVTNFTESYAKTNIGRTVALRRTFDAYGLMTSETLLTNGTSLYTAGNTWDTAGRRSSLNLPGQTLTYGWRADGLLGSATIGSGSGQATATYVHTSAGLLTNRTVLSRQSRITSRDGMGRPLGVTTLVNGSTLMTETLAYTGDGLISTHTVARPDFTDNRAYFYGNDTRRLVEERLNLDGSKRWTNSFTFDAGFSSGPGVLTRMGQPATSGVNWRGARDSLLRTTVETNNVITRPAYGQVNGPAVVSVALDGVPQAVTVIGTNGGQWRATLELLPGAHQLTASAAHPSGLFTTNRTAWFTNNVANNSVSNLFDGSGNIAQKVWRNPNGTTNRLQTFTWDARNRLVKVTDRDSTQTGRDWQATFDPIGRRLRTVEIPVTNGVVLANQPKIIGVYFDPLFEFQEMGVAVDGVTTWKLMGPDLDGQYGSLNGLGGFEGVTTPFGLNPVVSDARGNVLAVRDENQLSTVWNESRPTAYGSAPVFKPAPLGHGASLVQASSWRGRWLDSFGLYQIGERPYSPESGSWMSYDSLGHDASISLRDFCAGDPVNLWDADGRLGKSWINTANTIRDNNESSVGDRFAAMAFGLGGTLLTVPGAIDQTFRGASAGMADARAEINTYTGGKAALARTLMLPADFAFGTTKLVVQPVDTISGMPRGFVNFGQKIGTDAYGVYANPSVNSVFNVVEDAVGIWGLAEGGAAIYRTGTGLIPPRTVSTPHGSAVQATTAEAQAALSQVQNGATIYRTGEFGVQNTGNAQFWAIESPAATPGYAGQLGMPGATAPTFDWIMGGRVAPGSPVITRPAPGIGANAGGSMEAVVPPNGVKIDWFHMPD
jgi:RHS repeat-associated protein